MAKYYVVVQTKYNKDKLKEARLQLKSLDRVLLEKCEFGMNIVRLIKAGKPYTNLRGERRFATTDEVLASVDKLEKLGLVERR